MILILELALLVAGLISLFSGKIPEWMAGKGYTVTGPIARIIGVIMMIPIVGAFCVGLTLGVMVGSGALPSDALGYTSCIEIALVLTIAIGSGIWIRSARQPIAPPNPPPT